VNLSAADAAGDDDAALAAGGYAINLVQADYGSPRRTFRRLRRR
jgi:hypothetical protein